MLSEQARTNPAVFSENLAEYVFFPLAHIFRQVRELPTTLIETCLECLTLLIRYGWKSKITPQMVREIFILLTFIIEGKAPGSTEDRTVPEETILLAFRAETTLLEAAGTSAIATSSLTDAESLPTLGHGITIMLDAAVDGPSPEVQVEAIHALQVLYTELRHQEALATFLPGALSNIVKILSTPARYKQAVLIKCLKAVGIILTRVLADIRIRPIAAQQGSVDGPDDEKNEKSQVLSQSWLKATTGKVKVAISTVAKLRTHDGKEVRQALRGLCIHLLDECHTTLHNCSEVLIETAIVLESDAEKGSLTETSLFDLVNIYPELGDAIKSSVYSWASSLPRIMQGSDDLPKRLNLRNIASGIEILHSLRIESATLTSLLSANLMDSIMTSIQSAKVQPIETNLPTQIHNLRIKSGEVSDGALYHPVMLSHQSQKELRQEMVFLIQAMSTTTRDNAILGELLQHTHELSSDRGAAAFWLCFEMIKAADTVSANFDAYLDLSNVAEDSGDIGNISDELYNLSVQVLDSHADSESQNWRLEAVAMEVTAYVAQKSGLSFRPELIDVLFPIATFLGSTNTSLQQHAVATLNSLATCCEYSSVSDMIIDNVDYMLNSISLRLNTLDISPATTQVLLMMIRIAGSSLIPYLDDVVESIFAALDNYHGYSAFVESLFSVLKEIVDQASRSGAHLLTAKEKSETKHQKAVRHLPGLDDLFELLDRRKERQEREAIEDELGEVQGHPKIPWKSNTEENGDADATGDDQPTGQEEPKPPNSPTYQMLLRVSSLSQYYLTSPTPELRRLLLELLTTCATILSGDEDAFFPLVNSIWPVVVDRLEDTESFVTIEACHALAGLCEACGDFLASRFKTQWDDSLRSWCRKTKQQASTRTKQHFTTRKMHGTAYADEKIVLPIRSAAGELVAKAVTSDSDGASLGSLGQYASPVKVWGAVVALLTAIIKFVRVDDEMFDDILDLLSEELEGNQQVRDALETINADAVWLVRYEKGLVTPMETPSPIDGMVFIDMKTPS